MNQYNIRNLIRTAHTLEVILNVPIRECMDLPTMDTNDLELYVDYLKQSDRGDLYSPIEI